MWGNCSLLPRGGEGHSYLAFVYHSAGRALANHQSLWVRLSTIKLKTLTCLEFYPQSCKRDQSLFLLVDWSCRVLEVL